MTKRNDTPHAFVDESSRRSYVLVATRLDAHNLAPARGLVRELSEGTRVHMAKEHPRRRRVILSRLSGSGLVTADVFAIDGRGQSNRKSRDECFKELVPVLIDKGVTRLTIETCDQDRDDKSVIGQALVKANAVHQLHFKFVRPTMEPLLATADVIAWAYGAGRDWRRRAEPMIESVITCGI